MTTPTTDEQQFEDRYGLKTSVDKLRDAIYNGGPSMTVHLDRLKLVNTAVPEFFMTAAFSLGAYLNNQPAELDNGTVEAVTYLIENYGVEARAASFEAGADVLGGAINDLGISLRKAGKIKWDPKTPSES